MEFKDGHWEMGGFGWTCSLNIKACCLIDKETTMNRGECREMDHHEPGRTRGVSRRGFLESAGAFAFAGCATGAAPQGPVRIEKVGTIDIYITEANPIVFGGKPWLMEYIRYRENGKRYRHNMLGASYFRFRDLTDLNRFSAPFGKGLHMGNAFVRDGRIYVTAVENWGKSRFYQMESADMVHWTEPRVILEDPAWAGHNTTMCEADGRFVLSFELGKPKELVGQAFTMFFAESTDLKSWRFIDGAVMGRERYTGAPMLRHHGGWFYYFHLQIAGRGYKTRVCRSRDLCSWELSPHVVLDYDPVEDRRLHPGVRFTDAERAEIACAKDVNASDLDMCEFGGKLICCYSWGDQHGNEFLSLGRADCTEREFCESFFG